MEETNRTFADDEGEETMVTPRFDDEETVLARPVVPLEDVGDAHAAPARTPATATTTPLYSRVRSAPRRSLVAVLVVVSALVGSVLGVGGLYLYQKQRNADAKPAAEQQQADAPATQPTAEAASESQSREMNAPASQPSAPAPAASEPEAQAADDDADSSKDEARSESASGDSVARREDSESRNPVSTPKRGKKGERDEEIQRDARRSNRDDDEDRPVRADDSDDDRREARRVGVITYRPRRVRPRRGPYADTDRLRRIFEGQP
jgi:hypothetical protein